ncbi:hypothetical protein CC2G_012208 [Coprinopsis cinerea AmutBmut pab1-1]|nr:hypothetical protein CC2G_012208 [Coprinopsis cinerea AmutBmut pab1-1]
MIGLPSPPHHATTPFDLSAVNTTTRMAASRAHQQCHELRVTVTVPMSISSPVTVQISPMLLTQTAQIGVSVGANANIGGTTMTETTGTTETAETTNPRRRASLEAKSTEPVLHPGYPTAPEGSVLRKDSLEQRNSVVSAIAPKVTTSPTINAGVKDQVDPAGSETESDSEWERELNRWPPPRRALSPFRRRNKSTQPSQLVGRATGTIASATTLERGNTRRMFKRTRSASEVLSDSEPHSPVKKEDTPKVTKKCRESFTSTHASGASKMGYHYEGEDTEFG